MPYALPANLPVEVDYRVMLTFLEFYEVLLKFVNFKLFTSLGFHYPLEIDENIENNQYFSFKSFLLKNKETE